VPPLETRDSRQPTPGKFHGLCTPIHCRTELIFDVGVAPIVGTFPPIFFVIAEVGAKGTESKKSVLQDVAGLLMIMEPEISCPANISTGFEPGSQSKMPAIVLYLIYFTADNLLQTDSRPDSSDRRFDLYTMTVAIAMRLDMQMPSTSERSPKGRRTTTMAFVVT
jgi:hypothetical protein